MEADWEVEIGGGAPVIEALWPGFIDLRIDPERIVEIAEAADFAPLAMLLLALNASESPVWTAKCDRWEPEPGTMASYIDVLPREGVVFSEWQQAEGFCRKYVECLNALALPECGANCSVELVVRHAVAGKAEGFGVTAYLSATGGTGAEAAEALGAMMAGFAGALPPLYFDAT
jgi:hypothetical protein